MILVSSFSSAKECATFHSPTFKENFGILWAESGCGEEPRGGEWRTSRNKVTDVASGSGLGWFVAPRSEASDRGDRVCGSVDDDKCFLPVVMIELHAGS